MRVVLDWGIGGLPTWAALATAGVGAVYLSDSAATPYGKLGAASEEELSQRIVAVLRSLEKSCDEPIAELVVACNAASIVAPALRKVLDVPVFDVLSAGVRLMLRSPERRVGVIGGDGTIASGRIEGPLFAAGFDVLARSAQPLSAHVEAGRVSGAALRKDLEGILAPFGDRQSLLLACTHYPALAPVIEAMLPGVALVDPASALIEEVIAGASRNNAGGVWTTGEPRQLIQGAQRAFGIEVSEVRRLPFRSDRRNPNEPQRSADAAHRRGPRCAG